MTGWTVGEEIESWGLTPDTVCGEEEKIPSPKTPIENLSRGEMKRLHLACLLAKDWDVLILDEPFASLDCQEKTRLCRRLESLQETTVVLIFTHEQVHLPRVSYLWEMDNGILSCCGPVPEGIYSWRKAPFHIKCALSRQVLPKNITVSDALEALCRIPD
jgi:energy-coupling factor transport system ATP-binding protein